MELLLSSLDKTIRLKLDSKDLYEYFKSHDYVEETIPSFSASEKGGIADFDVIVEQSSRNKISLDADRKICIVHVNIEKLYRPDLVYLLLLIFTKLHEENGTYLVHAAAVNYHDKGVLLPGVPGSGKTGVAFGLLRRGGKYISNDRALIKLVDGVPFIVGGTSAMHVRIPTIKEFLKRDIALPEGIDHKDWNSKILLSAKELSQLGVEQGKAAEITAIVFPKIIMGSEETKMARQETDKGMLSLYGLLSEHIRAAGNMFITADWPFPCLDNEVLAKKRIEMVHRLLDYSKIFSATGPVDGIVSETTELLVGK